MTDIIQGSAEWFAARLGKVTASRVADITATTKSGYSTSRANYMAQLIAERLTGEKLKRPTAWPTAIALPSIVAQPSARADLRLPAWRCEGQGGGLQRACRAQAGCGASLPEAAVHQTQQTELRSDTTTTARFRCLVGLIFKLRFIFGPKTTPLV